MKILGIETSCDETGICIIETEDNSSNPKILFADEPTANLDTVSSEIVFKLFKKLNKELKQTILVVTHEPEDKKYVDRVIWLKDGLIENEE